MEFYIGQIFTEMYPSEAADWCNNNNCYMDEIEPENEKRRFQIMEVEQENDSIIQRAGYLFKTG